MTVKTIIQEALNRDPIALKEALEGELRSRVALVLEEKLEEACGCEDDNQFDEALNINRHKAIKIDKKNGVVHDYDEDTGLYHVLGVESGFSYSHHGSNNEAKRAANILNKHLKESCDNDKLDEAAKVTHKWYSVKHWKDGSHHFDNLDDLHHEREDKKYGYIKWGGDSKHKGRADHHLGVPVANTRAIAYMDKHAKSAVNEDLDYIDINLREGIEDEHADLHAAHEELSKHPLLKNAIAPHTKMFKSHSKSFSRAYDSGNGKEGHHLDSMEEDHDDALQVAKKHIETTARKHGHDDIADHVSKNVSWDKMQSHVIKHANMLHKRIGSVKEDVQLDEISKKTLGSYVKKASYNMGRLMAINRKNDWDKAMKRRVGIEKATDRLAKEDLDEVTTSAIKRPVKYTDERGITRTRMSKARAVRHDPESGLDKLS